MANKLTFYVTTARFDDSAEQQGDGIYHDEYNTSPGVCEAIWQTLAERGTVTEDAFHAAWASGFTEPGDRTRFYRHLLRNLDDEDIEDIRGLAPGQWCDVTYYWGDTRTLRVVRHHNGRLTVAPIDIDIPVALP